MPPLEFAPADRYSLDQLSRLLTRAYTGYAIPIDVDATGLQAMIAAYDIDLAASRVGVHKGELAAIALLGVRERRGWLAGMGVAPEMRGERAGLAVTQAVLKSGRRMRLKSIDLEVLTDNLPAIRIYESLGFKRRRTLDVWLRDSDATFPMPPGHDVGPLDVPACLAVFDDLRVSAPPWQRDLPVLKRAAPSMRALGTAESGRVTAYVLYRMEGRRVNVLDAAAAPGQRTQKVEALLRALIRERAGNPLRFVNLPQDDPASEAMRRVGAEVERQQHEMTLDL